MNALNFTREQIVFIAETILAGAFNRIEAMLPPNVPREEIIDSVHLTYAAGVIQEVTAMTLAILFAQTTGEGMGHCDWEGYMDFDKQVERLIERRMREKPDLDWHPNERYIAEEFSSQWAYSHV